MEKKYIFNLNNENLKIGEGSFGKFYKFINKKHARICCKTHIMRVARTFQKNSKWEGLLRKIKTDVMCYASIRCLYLD